MWEGGKRGNPEEESDTEPSTTTANIKKKKRNSKRKSAHLDAASSAGSSDDENYKTALELSLNTSVESEDEDMRRVLEMSKNDFVYIPDSDEERQMKKAIALSLGETIVVSDDEFDRMCDEPNMSLKEKLSKSSLDPEGSTPGTCKTWSKMNEPDTSNLPVRPKPPKPSQVPRPSTSRPTMPWNRGRGASRYPEDSEDYEDYDEREEEFSQSIGAILGMRNPSHGLPGHIAPHGQLLSSEEATRRMRGVFVNGLESKLNQEEMEPCKAIKTKLHSHQKSALAWMVKQENKENKGMMGGILGDEMGLGKTLTMISLIMTNYYDNRPLSKPNLGYTRPKIEMMRGGGKGKKKRILKEPTQSNVGKKIEDKVKKRSAIGFFSNFKSSDEEEEEKGEKSKFSFGNQKKKKSKRGFINDVDSTDAEDDPDLDDFDLYEKSSLSSRLKCKPEEKKIRDPRDEELDDMYSEWENMSQDEKDKKVRSLSQTSLNPGLNLDGAFDSSDDDIPICRKKTSNLVISSDDEAKAAEAKRSSKKLKIAVDSDSDVNLSDIDLETAPIPRQIRPAPEPSSSQPGPSKFSSDDPIPSSSSSSFTTQPSSSICRPESTLKPSTVKRIVPLAEPAQRKGRAHPTLIICPTSLLSHWCQEIDSHILPSVELKVKVHHGSNKAKLGADLNTYDIVLSTYGTLANELNADTSPLLRAKWLRVILDEGHYIKNHRSKTAKAANQLRTLRRWVVTGTPIQNNLVELWSLVNWLQFDLYAEDLNGFKNQIERPCKNREESGFERLQVLMDAICLRRTKNDKKANGDPIVPLPTKTIIIRDVKFTDDEKLCYSILSKEATNIVERYHQRGTLLRNYAIIFALMMRMRQLCCHREMIKTIDWTHVLRDRTVLERELAMFMDKEENGGMAEGEGGSEIDLRKRLAGQLRKMIQDGVTEDCSICLDDLKSPVITPCAHVYCQPCITRVLETVKPPICPLCRGPLSKNGLLEAGTDDDEQEESTDETLKALENIEVNVSSSKVNAAIKEMIRIREADPTDKIVVVSQFTTFLSIFQPILAEQGFSYVRLDGTMSHMDRAEVVRLFQKKTANSPKVLLLSLKAGGVGLNLTSANHLLLLDPAWNPAAEWQCFDRIHRIGQDKRVTIYKFITKEDSIEEKMMEIQAKKEELISGAFHMPDEERRRQRINDIMNIFNIGPRPQPAPGLPGPPAVPALPAPAPALAEA